MPRLRFLRQMMFDGSEGPLPPVARPNPGAWSNDEITGSCLGHSTVLMNFLGVRVLTDPVFSTRVGLGAGRLVLGPRRRIWPALWPQDFANPDVILLSHAHFDHFDLPSLRQFARDTPIVTAVATADLLRCLRFGEVHELAWGKSITLAPRGETLRITAVEVAHWGARLMKDMHRGYNGYLIQRQGRTVLFAGDTAYTSAFATLNDRRRPIDLALMPIGAYDPWIRAHCSPEQAAAMARQAGARFVAPIHHETFKLSDEPMTEPAERLRAAFQDEPQRLLALRVGETFRVPMGNAPSVTHHGRQASGGAIAGAKLERRS